MDSECTTSLIYYITYSASKDVPQYNLKSQTLTLSNGITHIPDEMVYKLTYPVKGQSQEGPLLSHFNGQFGIEDVIGYHNCGPEDSHGSTRHLLNNAKFWKVFQQQNLHKDRHHKSEERGLQCIALSGKGNPLIGLSNTYRAMLSPSELLETILHAIVGK
jgi:hypothetical protein